MSAAKISFKSNKQKDLSRELKYEVDNYFKKHNLSKHANGWMVAKTIILLTAYGGAYGLIMTGWFGPVAILGLCFIMGVGMAGIGFSISHDALHGAYSSNKKINHLMGYSFDLLGANSYIWKITHNIIHHTYTNIYEHDEDLEVAAFIRLSPNAPYKWIHKFQHVLAFFAYSFATLFWVFIKDYVYFFKKDLGPYEHKTHPGSEWIILIITKLLYYTYMLVLPLWLLPVSWWQVLIGFLVVHLTAGLLLGVVFQLAHVVEETDHPVRNEDGDIENVWMVHQLETTANFAHKNKLLCWYIGGLNYQIEHHLFPRICSIHYPKISPIVRRIAARHGIVYNYNENLRRAIQSHYHALKKFGDSENG